MVGIQNAWKDNLDNYPMEWVRVNDQIWGKLLKRLNREEIGGYKQNADYYRYIFEEHSLMESYLCFEK